MPPEAPIGERPIALGHHRFEWLYVTGFVEPTSGRTVWNVSNAVCKEMFSLILADFAEAVGAGARKRIVLQLDNAGWHGPKNLAAPDGIHLVFQPAHSPELQPAEHLWPFVDEPHREPRPGGRRSLRRPCPAARHDPKQHAVPLVATSASAELISRRWYHLRKSCGRSCAHVHQSPRIVQWLKGTSSRVLLQEFPHLKKQYWGRHLWARGYFAVTSGTITDEMINEYINEQEGEAVQDDSRFEIDPS